MFDWTKDASGRAHMLLSRPGFLSFQKTPPAKTKKIGLNVVNVSFLSCDLSPLSWLEQPKFFFFFFPMTFHWAYLWSQTRRDRWFKKKWLQVVVTCFLFIIIIVLSMTSIIIAIIYKNENPMVCLLALWVSKCFFSLRPAVILYIKKMDFPYFLCS